MSTTLTFALPGAFVTATIRRLLCAGYTGRTLAEVEAHIEELKPLGIGAPPHVPMLFPIMPALLSQAVQTHVMGPNTAPEVEFVQFRADGRDYVTVGSDHTDAVMEAQAAALAKNLCFKSVAPQAWAIDEIAGHWDTLELQLVCNGKVMQKGSVAQMMTPAALRDFVATFDGPEHEGRMIFSGTFETHGHYPQGEMAIEISLTDPVLGRSIAHAYKVTPLAEIFPAVA